MKKQINQVYHIQYLTEPEMNVSRVCRNNEDSCSGIEVQDLFVVINQNNSLLYYCELKHKWG
jgi:hypothetical protein